MNFEVDAADHALIVKICERYERFHQEAYFIKPNRLALMMDLSACHNSCPLRLQDLLDADLKDFAHDVSGIQASIDRDTGRLTNGFSLRYAR